MRDKELNSSARRERSERRVGEEDRWTGRRRDRQKDRQEDKERGRRINRQIKRQAGG